MYKCRHFKIEELVPPSVLADLGDRAWMVMDDRMLKVIDDLREDLGKPITVNIGGKTQSGFREYGKVAAAAKYSQHYFGRALDIAVKGMTADEVRKYIKDNHVKYQAITRMEMNTPTWVHIDCANEGDGLVLFNP